LAAVPLPQRRRVLHRPPPDRLPENVRDVRIYPQYHRNGIDRNPHVVPPAPRRTSSTVRSAAGRRKDADRPTTRQPTAVPEWKEPAALRYDRLTQASPTDAAASASGLRRRHQLLRQHRPAQAGLAG